MIQLSRPFNSLRRRGAVTLIVAVCSLAMFGILAIAIDAGVLQDRRRQVQAAADAAALAAAKDLFDTYGNSDAFDNGQDPNGVARNHAFSIANDNGYSNDGTTSIVTVNIPPTSGPYARWPGHAEVIIEYRQKRYFSTIFGSQDIPIRARAVARGKFSPKSAGIIVLDPTARGALTVAGNATGMVKNASVQVNSSDAEAAVGEGTTAVLTAEVFTINGGVSQNGLDQFNGPVFTNSGTVPDPYRDLPEPDPIAQPLQLLADQTVEDHGNGYRTYYLKPGRYVGGLSFEGKTSVVMEPGIYYMEGNYEGGGFRFSGNDATSLTAEGVMLFNDRGTNSVTSPDSEYYPSINITGQAKVRWSPPMDGVYKGISFFQARGQDMTLYIAGQGDFVVRGAFYAPDALTDVAGSGESIIGSQFITGKMLMRGQGSYTIDFDPELVPPVRQWHLVE